MSESSLLALLLRRAPELVPELRLFRRQIMTVGVGERVMRAGIKGQADLYGIWKGGRHIEIEVKSLGGRLSEAQERWMNFCEGWGIPWLVLRPEAGESDEEAVGRWCQLIVEAMKPRPAW